MLTLLSPFFFYAALGVAAGVVALHFIVTRQPTSSALPTVRFVPRSTVRVVTLSRPRDLLLLLLRVLLILLIGLAFARPILLPERRPVARIVLADLSRHTADIEEVRDSARALLGPGDALVAFDREARVVLRGAADTIAALQRSPHEGRLSAALVAALRTAPELRDQADSVEIAIISPLRAEQVDGATDQIRSLWPGRIRLVPVAAGADTLAPPSGLVVRAESDDDGVALAARLAGITSTTTGDSQVRIVRGEVTAEDSAWVAGGRRTLVRWPVEGAPPGWRERAQADTAGAVIATSALAGTAALVYPLERRWEPALGETVAAPGEATSAGAASSETESAATASGANTSAGTAPRASASAKSTSSRPEWRVAARWVDGEPAAMERRVGAGCIRDVAIPVPGRGDLAFRPSFGELVRALGAPCEATAGSVALGAAALETLAGSGPLAPRDSIPAPEVVTSPLVPWLLALALLLALVELWARRNTRGRAPGGEGSARVAGAHDSASEGEVMTTASGSAL